MLHVQDIAVLSDVGPCVQTLTRGTLILVEQKLYPSVNAQILGYSFRMALRARHASFIGAKQVFPKSIHIYIYIYPRIQYKKMPEI